MKPKITASQVYSLTSMIPKGKVGTYGDIARTLGNPRSSRQVGRFLHLNPHAPKVPCHRVVHSDGRLGGYAKGVRRKVEMLQEEGIAIEDDRIADFEMVRFRGYSKTLRKV
ncbi:MAG: MGMT family protein [Thaumarchaeota archaeon]|nr:MGMT family protein [Nitrososphaerota archaeon]